MHAEIRGPARGDPPGDSHAGAIHGYSKKKAGPGEPGPASLTVLPARTLYW
jgi:hypothetical protein